MQEEKGATEDEMVVWHYRLDGHGFGWTPGVGDGQGGLARAVHGVAKSRIQLSNCTELNNHRERCSTIPVIKEIQFKSK